MNPNQALWEKGDFTRVADLMRQSGEAVVKSLGITPPLRALDLWLWRRHDGGSPRTDGG